MRTTYEKPSVEEWCAESAPLMLGSITVSGYTATIKLDDTEEYNDVFCSRRTKDVWEDEDEKDEP